MGGAIAVPMSDEQYHEIMDVAESIVDRDIHEKCLLGSGALVIWNGRSDVQHHQCLVYLPRPD